MGYEMIAPRALVAAALLSAAAPALAQENDSPAHAVGTDLTYSTDADDTEVIRAGLNLDWRYRSSEDYQGIRLERAWFSPPGLDRTSDDRVYFRMANRLDQWKYQLNAGTDGDTVLGSASIHNEAPLRQEYFIEREKLETRLGVSRGIYYTFGGAALDVPLGERDQLTLLGGLQTFTGDNVRSHLRANYVHVLKPEWGLSAQLRTRYFRNSTPREYDYYSPRWFAEVLPVLQMRRFSGGWRYLGAIGWGGQRDSGSKWRQSRYANLRVTSPSDRRGWAVAGELTYSNIPITDSPTYDYVRASFGLTRAF